MGLDWIDDILQKAEGLPVLGGIAQKLRFAYEIWRIDPPDPKPVQTQYDTLDKLHTRAVGLRTAFSDALYQLQSKWTGNEASYYFGPQVTAFEIEHDLEPPITGAGYILWNRLNQLTDALDYNRAAHQQAHDTLVQIQNLHGQLQSQVYEAAGLLVADVAEAAIPGAEELDIGTVPLTIERTDEAVQTGEEVVQVGKAIKTVDVVMNVAKVVGLAVLALGAIVGVVLIKIFVFSNNGSPKNLVAPPSAPIKTLTDADIHELSVTYGVDEATIRELMQRYPNLTLEQLIDLLSQWDKIKAKYPNLVAKAGGEDQALLLFVMLSMDPAHTAKNGAYNGDINTSMHESEVLLDLAEQGLIPTLDLNPRNPILRKLKQNGYDINLISRQQSKDAAEGTDGTGQDWDEKGADFNKDGSVNVDSTAANIEHDLDTGENVIVDETGMTSEQAQQLAEKLKSDGVDLNRILWWQNGVGSTTPI